MPKVLINGQLKDTTDEDIQSLAKTRGLEQPPITPLGAANLGATPDQIKMQGTPAQKLTIAPKQELATQQRQEQANAQLSALDAQKKQKSDEALASYGPLGKRAQDLINKYIKPAPLPEGEAPQLQTKLNEATIAGLGLRPEQEAPVRAALQKAGSGAQLDAADYQTLSEAGVTDLGKLDQFLDKTGSVTGSVATATPDKVLASEVGLATADIQALGLAEGATLQDAQAAIQQQIEQEFTQTETLKQQASNPNVGPQERLKAMKQLRDMGASGVFATEQDMGNLAQSVDAADMVKFNGKDLPIAELLDDEHMSGVVATYLTDENAKAELKKNNPEFAQYIDTHAAAFTELTSQLDEAGKTVQDNINSNASVGKTQGGDLNDSTLKTIFPDSYNPDGSKKFSTERIDTSTIPIYKNLFSNDKIPLEAKQEAVTFMNQHPERAAEFKDLSPQEITKLGLNDPTSKAWQGFKQFNEAYDALDNIGAMNNDEILSKLFGQEISSQDLNIAAKQGVQPAKSMDVNKDGKVSTTELGNYAKAKLASGSIQDYLKTGGLEDLGEAVSEGKNKQSQQDEKIATTKAEKDAQKLISEPRIKDILQGKTLDKYKKSLVDALAKYKVPSKDIKYSPKGALGANITTKEQKAIPKELNTKAVSDLKGLLKEEQALGNKKEAASLEALLKQIEPIVGEISTNTKAKQEADAREKKRNKDTKKDMVNTALAVAPSPALKAIGVANKAAPVAKKLLKKIGL